MCAAEYKDSLPSLNEAQITKLKHLTLVSLAMEKRVRLTQLLSTAINDVHDHS